MKSVTSTSSGTATSAPLCNVSVREHGRLSIVCRVSCHTSCDCCMATWRVDCRLPRWLESVRIGLGHGCLRRAVETLWPTQPPLTLGHCAPSTPPNDSIGYASMQMGRAFSKCKCDPRTGRAPSRSDRSVLAAAPRSLPSAARCQRCVGGMDIGTARVYSRTPNARGVRCMSPTEIGLAGSARLGSARLGSARLGSARLGSAQPSKSPRKYYRT
jgi:hypothetical protein